MLTRIAARSTDRRSQHLREFTPVSGKPGFETAGKNRAEAGLGSERIAVDVASNVTEPIARPG